MDITLHRSLRNLIFLAALLPISTFAEHDHGSRSVRFSRNLGQWDQPVLYKSGVNGATVFMERNGISWVKYEDGTSEKIHNSAELSKAERDAMVIKGHAWRMRFFQPSQDLSVSAEDIQPGYENYFLGNEPSKWKHHVPAFSEVIYNNVWEGIDVRYHAVDGNLKYDVLLKANSDPNDVAFYFDGLDGIAVNADGQLIMLTSVGNVVELKPIAFYSDGTKEPLKCDFQVRHGMLRFLLEEGYDHDRPITIDPVLIASTLSGAVGSDNYGHCATYDNSENIYSGARNFGSGYPATVGAFQIANGGGGTDMSFSKYNPDGSNLIWATYLGGSSGENPHSMIVNSLGELCILGSTSSSNYPVSSAAMSSSNGGGTDMVITHFSADCSSVIGSTYVGGTAEDGVNSMWGNYGETYRGEIFLDGANNILVASFTSSSNFPTTAGCLQAGLGGAQDAVVLAIQPNCSSLLYSTYLGGTANDSGLGLRIAANGDVFVTGGTESSNFPTTPGSVTPSYMGGTRDGYVVRLTSDLTSMIAGTFFGTDEEDTSYFLDIDLNEDVWIYGQTEGIIPISPVGTYGQANAGIFIAKFSGDLTSLPITTTIGPIGGGGWGTMAPVAFLVDVCDNIYISGYNSPSDQPMTANSLYQTGSFYLAAFDVDMADLLFGTYYGGSHVDGGTSRFDKNGVIYQGVCSGMGSLQTTPWAWATNQTIGWDIGVFKIDFQVAGVNAAGAGTLNEGCAPIQIDFVNNSTGDGWIWDFGDGSLPVNAFEPSYTYTTPGAYTVTLIAYDSLACNMADTITFPVTIGQAQTLTGSFTYTQNSDCSTFQIITTNTSTGSPIAFEWDMGDGTQYTDTNVTHNYDLAGTYDIQLITYDPTGCSQPDTLLQQVFMAAPDTVGAVFTIDQVPNCDDVVVSTTNASSGNAPTYTWNMGDGTQLTGTDVTHTFSGPGTYTIQLIAVDSSTCNIIDSTEVQITIDPLVPIAAAFTIDQVFDCAQMIATTDNQSVGSNMAFEWNMGDGTLYTDSNATHTYTTPGTFDITLVVVDLWGCVPNDTSYTQVTIDPIDPVVADFVIQQTDSCTLLLVTTNNLSTGDSLSYSWDMGDGTVYDTFDPSHTYTDPGTYNVTLTITDLGCGQNDQMTLPVTLINELPTALVPTAIICFGETTVLDATSNVDSYVWSTGETTPTITVDHGGIFVVNVYTGTCFGQDSVEVFEGLLLDLTDSLNACPHAEVVLSVPMAGTAYQWETGSTSRTETVYGAGVYPYTVWDDLNCPHMDTITVIALDPDALLFAPNAFTPDGDGKNDTFIITGYGEGTTELLIFDRWGEKVYETGSPIKPWDGTYKGTPVKNDMYVYRLEYNAECARSEQATKLGHIMVVR
ncbi:MAG: PKD domain-containing protein [Flavobacteriales bacterium]|mgnify:CR=1 FL=1|nr:PKD domain-containing protein [Flavobacteriales bacterium]MBK6943257.1 PKD domain-containing protein [Flavobacteriales bacterium]MBK7240865.1 PKD domain-containing protein [Flavobacteriales bacterium]MBK9536212.1 PKD domain-containing protein [Flavobacteriales bacterium]MBP9137876.1 PKD domain-containing protein [Flavobacteriales bacterium]